MKNTAPPPELFLKQVNSSPHPTSLRKGEAIKNKNRILPFSAAKSICAFSPLPLGRMPRRGRGKGVRQGRQFLQQRVLRNPQGG
jgi:hypothetical protein